MPALSLDTLKSLGDNPPLRCRPVPVPELGDGMVAWIAELSAYEKEQRLELPWLKHKESSGQDDQQGFRAFVVAACLCQSEQRDFVAATPAQVKQVADLLGKQGVAVARMYEKADQINAVGTEQVEEIEKN